jgi:hypothetical protein
LEEEIGSEVKSTKQTNTTTNQLEGDEGADTKMLGNMTTLLAGEVFCLNDNPHGTETTNVTSLLFDWGSFIMFSFHLQRD